MTWTVTFIDGVYTFQCDAHPTEMKGAFAVGTATSRRPRRPSASRRRPPGSRRGRSSRAPLARLHDRAQDGAGKAVKKVNAGMTYRVTVAEDPRVHNFHLTGKGVNKKTVVGRKQKATWKVKFKKGTYRFRCDSHPTVMKGSFKAS